MPDYRPKDADGHPEIMHRLIDDDDGHWYVIRADELKAFNAWLDAGPYLEGYKGKDFNTCRVDGPHTVVFPTWDEQ